ncbi:aldose epimerase family protein [Lacimicrobium alkaliphilum]|nr:aldose epimerase family protein [Lacimicrobium alkaliphilum]
MLLYLSTCSGARRGFNRSGGSFSRQFATLAACVTLLFGLSACSEGPQSQSASQPQAEKETSMSSQPSFSSQDYGTLSSGEKVTQVTLRNSNGIEMDVISYGGIITRLLTPDAQGQMGDIVLGLDSLEEYVQSNPYFGALIGRYGNRINKGRFELEGRVYQLDTNDGENHLHGGVQGFDKRNWQMTPFKTDSSAGVELALVSEDGDQGYPGRLEVKVVYELSNNDELDMRFEATTDKPTIVNMTQHSYFNLAGSGDILGHELMIPADAYTPVDEGLIPTGEIADISNTPFDFREPTPMGERINEDHEQLQRGQGYDHNYVLDREGDGKLRLAARVEEPVSGRVLEVASEEPGVQFYSGNFLDGSLTGKGTTYQHRSGFCLEPQHFPDSPNQAMFPSTRLNPGETYRTRIIYRFLTRGDS